MVTGVAWPPATLPLTGLESVPLVQNGKVVGAPSGSFGGGGGGGPGGTVPVPNYATIRATNYPNTVNALVLEDTWKGGTFIRATSGKLTDNGGTRIVDAGGQCWKRIWNTYVNAAWFYDAPTTGNRLGDGAGVPITATDIANNPQWIGLPPALGGGNYPVGTTWDYVAIQQCTYACFASGSVPGTVTWNASASTSNLPMWLPPGKMIINQPWYFCANGFEIMFAQRAGSTLWWTGAVNTSPVQMDAIAYGIIRNLSITDAAGISGFPLIDCNWTGANPGIKTQQLTFESMTLGGALGNHGTVGFFVARTSGGGGQGDTIVLINPLITGCNQAVIMGGSNAVNLTVIGGNVQGNVQDGFATYGGSFQCYNTSFQGGSLDFHNYPIASQITMGGADSHVFPGGGQTARCALRDTRSENTVISLDQNRSTRLDNVSAAQAYGILINGWGASAHFQQGTIIGTGGSINTAAVWVDDGGPAWFQADGSSTNTVIVQNPSPGWTVNQWAGYLSWFRYGNSFCFAGTVASNTANTATNTAGWYTPEPPTITVPNLAGYWVKIQGITGTTQPAWDTFPPGGFSALAQSGSPGYGFTTYAGSNVVSSGNAGISNGMYVMVTGALGVRGPNTSTVIVDGALTGKVQNYTNGAAFTASLAAGGVLTISAMTSGTIKIGAVLQAGWTGSVILSQTGGTPNGAGTYTVSNPTQPALTSRAMTTLAAWEMVNAHGDVLPATYTLTDAMGYWGQPIPDGQGFWMPLDFNAIFGASSGDNIDPGQVGKFQDCGLMNFAWNMAGSVINRFRTANALSNYTYRNGGAIAQPQQSLVGATVNPLNITGTNVSTQGTISYSNALAAFTVNMPTWLTNVIQSVRLTFSNITSGAVLTWGTNVVAASPTVNLGTGGSTVTICELTWGLKPNVWVVTSVTGPF